MSVFKKITFKEDFKKRLDHICDEFIDLHKKAYFDYIENSSHDFFCELSLYFKGSHFGLDYEYQGFYSDCSLIETLEALRRADFENEEEDSLKNLELIKISGQNGDVETHFDFNEDCFETSELLKEVKYG